MSKKLVFLKLGGSLITDKNLPHTPRPETMERLAAEIADACAQDQDLRILLGHGSGSFGHVPASQYNTRQGVKTSQEWKGFAEVWRQATELNHLLLNRLHNANLPALAFPPSATIMARDGNVAAWTLEPLLNALEHGLLPVIYGDVVFDRKRGGTILSTEDIFAYLAQQLRPTQILLAGLQPGVWQDFPHNTNLFKEITPVNFPMIEKGLAGSLSTDVTGGMLEKVRLMLSLVEQIDGLSALIFSGETPGNVTQVLLGKETGTILRQTSS